MLAASRRSLFAMVLLTAFAGCTSVPFVKGPQPAGDGYAEPAFARTEPKSAGWALVLSSGAVRGFAHIGVLKAFDEAGLKPDLIVGTSAGALVGALAASGLTGGELEALDWDLGVRLWNDWTIPRLGMLSGRSIFEFVNRTTTTHRIEDFPIRFAAVAVEADRGCLQVFNRGDAGMAVQASSTVPLMVSPPRIGGRRYLDGALASPLPVRIARALGAQRIVAVDATYDPKESSFNHIVDAFWRTSLVMRWALTAIEAAEADVLVAPRLPDSHDVRVDNKEVLIAAGEAAARAALPAIAAMLSKPPPADSGTARAALRSMLCDDIAQHLLAKEHR